MFDTEELPFFRGEPKIVLSNTDFTKLDLVTNDNEETVVVVSIVNLLPMSVVIIEKYILLDKFRMFSGYSV